MRVLVTGSEGKIGKEVMKLLDGHEVYALDKKGGASYKIDLSTDPLNSLIDFQPEIIIHLAASFERTDETRAFHAINFQDNILATYRLNQAIAKMKVAPKQYIYASSYLVYDPNLYLSPVPLRDPRILSEVDELSPRNLIGHAKLYGEGEINFLQRNVHPSMKVTHARIFRVFGEGGQEFVSRVIDWRKNGFPVDIWKPENRFDYIAASDCASALVSLFDHEGIYNVGYGVSHSIKDILDVVKPEIRTIHMNDLYESTEADIMKIEEETGWSPKVNVLDWIKGKL